MDTVIITRQSEGGEGELVDTVIITRQGEGGSGNW